MAVDKVFSSTQYHAVLEIAANLLGASIPDALARQIAGQLPTLKSSEVRQKWHVVAPFLATLPVTGEGKVEALEGLIKGVLHKLGENPDFFEKSEADQRTVIEKTANTVYRDQQAAPAATPTTFNIFAAVALNKSDKRDEEMREVLNRLFRAHPPALAAIRAGKEIKVALHEAIDLVKTAEDDFAFGLVKLEGIMTRANKVTIAGQIEQAGQELVKTFHDGVKSYLPGSPGLTQHALEHTRETARLQNERAENARLRSTGSSWLFTVFALIVVTLLAVWIVKS